MCEQVESLAQPWLNLQVLAHADYEILQDILLQARQAEQELEAGTGSRAWRWAGGSAC